MAEARREKELGQIVADEGLDSEKRPVHSSRGHSVTLDRLAAFFDRYFALG